MAHFPCEMFGHFFYCPELGYEELGELEQDLKSSLSEMLEARDAVHVEYREYGEALAVQCQFPEFSCEAFQAFCVAVRDILTKDVEAKFLFVDRENLADAFFCAVTFERGCRGRAMPLPRAADFCMEAEKTGKESPCGAKEMKKTPEAASSSATKRKHTKKKAAEIK